MNIKKWSALVACLVLLEGLLSVPVLALDSGVYTGSVITSYYNPDTGNVDDGGTANAALGEGMCRSATAETGFVEVDADGNIWLTIRLLLQSNCKDIAFYTRTDYDSYSQVSYTVTAEDVANDSIDYRFKVSDAGAKLKCTMYVTPMGRDVLWYLYIDTSSLASASPEPDDTQTEAPDGGNDTIPEETKVAMAEDSSESAEPVPEETEPITGDDPVESSGIEDADTVEPASDISDDTTEEDNSKMSTGAVAGIVIAVVAVAGIIAVVRRRRK